MILVLCKDLNIKEDLLNNFLVLKFSEIGGEKFLNEIFKKKLKIHSQTG